MKKKNKKLVQIDNCGDHPIKINKVGNHYELDEYNPVDICRQCFNCKDCLFSYWVIIDKKNKKTNKYMELHFACKHPYVENTEINETNMNQWIVYWYHMLRMRIQGGINNWGIPFIGVNYES